MSVLLIAEHNNKEVRPFTYNAITAASQINEDLHVLVLGHQADDVAKSLSCLLYTSPSPRDPKTSRMPSSA